ncbi:hypothetical protein D3C76_1417650 [compost metagenome]
MRHRSAIGIAHNQPIGAGFLRFAHHCNSVVRVVFISIEEVLGIENDLKALTFQVGYGVINHGQIFL